MSNNKKSAKNEIAEVKERKFLEPRNFVLSQEDLEEHKKFITKNFKQNLWGY